jgi:hypothetical protein
MPEAPVARKMLERQREGIARAKIFIWERQPSALAQAQNITWGKR